MSADFRPPLDWSTATVSAPYTAGDLAPAFRIDAAGNTHLRGRLNVAPGMAGTPAFVLPPMYRPKTLKRIPVATLPGGTTGRVNVNAAGEVTPITSSGKASVFFLDVTFASAGATGSGTEPVVPDDTPATEPPDVVDALEAKVDLNVDQILQQMTDLEGQLTLTGNHVFRQADKPTEAAPGDTWYDTDDANRLYVFDATAGDFIEATSSYLFTPDGTMEWTPHGLASRGPNGLTFSLTAGSGDILMNGNLAAVDINGAVITGGTIQTSDQPNEGLKLVNGGMWGYNSATGQPTFVVGGTTGSFFARGVFETGAATGPRVTMSTALVGAQQWGMLQFHTGTAGWNPAQVWSVYEGGGGVMRLSSPHQEGTDWSQSASISLTTAAGGASRSISLAAQTLSMDANTFKLGSNGTTVDFNLQGTSLFQVIGTQGRLNFETFAAAGGVTYNAIGSWNGSTGNVRKALQIVAGGQVVFDLSGTRNLTMQQPFNHTGVPSLIDKDADVALAFKNRTPANGYGFLHVTDWSGDARRDLRCGIIQTTSVDTSSDIALKRDLTPLDGVLPLLLSDEATPYEYDLYDRDPDTAVYAMAEPVRHLGRRRGAIANDLVDVLPELISGSPGSYSVDVYGLTSTLLAGLRELAAKTDAEIADLRAQLAALS